MQVSYGDLKSPVELEPDTHVKRTTASITYHLKNGGDNWATTLAYGRNCHLCASICDVCGDECAKNEMDHCHQCATARRHAHRPVARWAASLDYEGMCRECMAGPWPPCIISTRQ
jgi:hypothetical protein